MKLICLSINCIVLKLSTFRYLFEETQGLLACDVGFLRPLEKRMSEVSYLDGRYIEICGVALPLVRLTF